MTPVQAAILLRSSEDPSKDARSMDSQRSGSKRTCRAKGWAYGEEYKDTVSASEYGAAKGVVRKDFERLKRDLETGRFGVLIVPSVSRTARDIGVLEDLRKILVRHKMLLCIGDRVMDPSEAADTTLILIEGVLAQTFSQNQSKDIRRGVREARTAGRAPAGRCPFGYWRPPRTIGERVVQVPHTINGPLLQWAVREALPGGQSLRQVAKRWSEEGSTDYVWDGTAVRRALRNPSIIGMTRHFDELLPGDWAPLVTAEEYSRAVDILTKPERRRMNHQQSTTLLSSIATHAGCGQKIGVTRAHVSKPVYRCRVSHSGPRLPVAVMDALVTEKLFEEIYFASARAKARAENRVALDLGEAYREEYERAKSEYEQLKDNWHELGFTLSEFAAALKPLRERMTEASAKVKTGAPVAREPMVNDPKVYPALWAKMTLDEQRRQVRHWVTVEMTREGVVVTPRGV